MQIRGLRHIMIVTVTQFAIVPCIDVLNRCEVFRTRRIIDGVEVDSLHINPLTRTILVRIVLPYEHHINDSIPDVVQFRPEQPIIVQK